MTSKQAFDILTNEISLIQQKLPITIKNQHELYSTITKDLEVLETVKQVFNYETIDEFMDNLTTNQFYEIKEWLEQ